MSPCHQVLTEGGKPFPPAAGMLLSAPCHALGTESHVGDEKVCHGCTLFLKELRAWCRRHVLNNHTILLILINAIEEMCRTPCELTGADPV